jgi:enoyl-CoA hydratase/carnithine racemase
MAGHTEAGFVEIQRFGQVWLWILLIAIAVITIGNLGFGMYRELILGKPFSHGEFLPDGTWLMIWIIGVGATIGPIALVWFARLVTHVGQRRLSVRFVPFHRRPKRIELSDAVSVEAVTYSALRDYGGYGIRSTRHGRAYNVGGNKGVRITFRNGEHLLIGSQRADELASAVELARAAAQGGWPPRELMRKETGMAYDGYECLRIEIEGGVASVIIDHPPINLFDIPMIVEMDRVGAALAADDAVRVIVFRSANAEFFIAHADVLAIQGLPTEVPPKAQELGFFQAMVHRFRSMPKASIGVVEGIARGGGSEFLLGLDMRFAALGKAVLGQPEVALGIIPGGGGTQYLPRLMGWGRAAEVILGCDDFSAELAERYGWVNRALPPDELWDFVDRLAQHIARFPAEAIALAKESLGHVERPLVEGLLEESHCFARAVATEPAQQRMARFMQIGGQTPEVETNLEAVLSKLVDGG